jgi:phosphatidylglycerophosphate synthase
MNKTNKRFLIIVFIVVVLLFLFFGSGEMMNGGINGRMNENGWLGVNSWWWFSAIVLLVFGVSFDWLFSRKKK